MASSTPGHINPHDLASFQEHLSKSKRIVALLGAGLSASSGLPTFRGAGGLWRNFDAVSLATPGAFARDPVLVWQFYSYRRHMSLNARLNRAHMALAALARLNPDFMTLSQNVDGLSPRADHPLDQLKLLHGSLFDIKCTHCDYIRRNDFTDPVVPELALPPNPSFTPTTTTTNPSASLIKGLDISQAHNPLPSIPRSSLPHCPQCHPSKSLLRPGVVWFGESLPEDTMDQVHAYFDDPSPVDLIMVIGTSAKVYPAAGYTEIARSKGARVCVVNMDRGDAQRLTERDWFFEGDAAVVVPELLRDVVGEVGEFQEEEGGKVLE